MLVLPRYAADSGRPSTRVSNRSHNAVSDGFFGTMEIPVAMGREFSLTDRPGGAGKRLWTSSRERPLSPPHGPATPGPPKQQRRGSGGDIELRNPGPVIDQVPVIR